MSAGSDMHRYKAQNHRVRNGLKKIKFMTQWRIQSGTLDDVRGEFGGEFHMYMRFHTSWGGKVGRQAAVRGYVTLESE